MKGIILAGGSGTRLFPLTNVVSKQLLPIYDKPMIYYPLATLMASGIREILIISTPNQESSFRQLLGDGSKWGVEIQYSIQNDPLGIAHALLIGRKFVGADSVTLILGDNIFFGHGLIQYLDQAMDRNRGATVFAYQVNDPQRYGVVEFDLNGHAISLEEKPAEPRSPFAVTGLYVYDNNALDIAGSLHPSERGELEITDVNRVYLREKRLFVKKLGRGIAWLDMGTFESLQQASVMVQALQERQGLIVCSPEEIAFRMGYITSKEFFNLAHKMKNSQYGRSLLRILDQETVAT